MTPSNSPGESAKSTGDGLKARHEIPAATCSLSSLVGVRQKDELQLIGEKMDCGASLYVWSPSGENAELQRAAVFVIESKKSPEDVRVYKLGLSEGVSLEVIVKSFSAKPLEHFEAYFSETLRATRLQDSEQSNSPRVEEPMVRYRDYCPARGAVLQQFSHRRGACIRLIEDPDNGDRVVAISASPDPQSQELLLRITQQRWNDACGQLIWQLASADDSAVKEIISELSQYVSSDPAVFREGRVPISKLVDDMVTTYGSVGAGAESSLTVKRRSDRSVEEAAERLLEQRDCVMVSYGQEQPSVSMWKKMFVTASDDGVGFLVLCVGRKDKDTTSSVGDESEEQSSHGRARYDFDLRDLSLPNREKWLQQLLNAFRRSREEFPGAITEFLNQQSQPSREDDHVRVVLRGVRGLKSEHLDAEQSVADFTKIVKTGLATQDLTVEVLSKRAMEVRLKCVSRNEDALIFTIKPHGIDTIYIPPREASDAVEEKGARFSLSNIYQLNAHFDGIVHQIGRYLHEESGSAESFTGRNNCRTGPIRAQNVLNYLNGLCAPRDTGSRHSNFPPQFDAVFGPESDRG